jgi:flagellar secretion chaperone FliS
MNPAIRAAQAYRRVESESRSPLELVVMLYDGALRFLGEAAAAAARGDLRARARAISRTLAIIAELQNTLDLEKGGDVATQLDELYTYITSRLLDVALKNDVTAIEEGRKLLTPIRDAWSQISTQSPVRQEQSVALRHDSGQAVGAP